MKALSRILLRQGAITVGVAPEHGALTRLDIRVGEARVEILRPAHDGDTASLWALGASSFLMLPYCGRLLAGGFQFDGQSFQYPLNAPPERHSSHGDAWTRRWALTSLDRHTARMTIEDDTATPLAYQCEQEISVRRNRVDVHLAIRNISTHPIPIGVGIHPYFANRSLAILEARLPLRWELDAELLPRTLGDNPEAAELLRGWPVRGMRTVNEFAGWDGTATIAWPALGVTVRVETNPLLKHAVLWVPNGEDFFCFEPMSHATDALNGHDGHPPAEDFVILQPRAIHEQRFALVIEAPLAKDGTRHA